MNDKDRIEKLPKWARDHIARIESDLRRAKKEIAAMTEGGDGRSNIGWGMDLDSPSDHLGWLPENESVRFYWPDQNRPRDRWIEVRHGRDGAIEIQGAERLTFTPEASNRIRIEKPEDPWP